MAPLTSVTLSGQTLPCAVQVTGGTINGITNVTPYHSIATALGTVNVTPLTDLLVANLAGTATPRTWFAGLGTVPAPISVITPSQVTAAFVKLRAAMSGFTSLNTINPITTTFTPTPGNVSDDTLSALKLALATTGVTYASLLGNASVPAFTAPAANFGTALTTAYSGLTGVTPTGGGSSTPNTPAYSWSAGSPVYATGANSTFTPSMASLSNGKLMAVYAQSESNGNKVYAAVGNYGTGTWVAPVALTGSVGSVQGVSNSSGWNQPTPSTVVAANAITGNALAAWTTLVTAETTYRVWVSAYNATANTWGSATQVGVALQPGLKATSSAAGGMAIAWIQTSTVVSGKASLGRYLSSSSGAITTDVLELGITSASGLKMGLSNADMLVVAWSGANQQVMLARRGTSSWTTPAVAGAGTPSEDANIDLAVATDGSGATVWRGIDPSIHTAVFDITGAINSTASLRVGSVDNARPAVAALGSGKFITVFASTSIATGSSGWYTPYSATYDPSTGWATPIMINADGQAGYFRVNVSANGNVMAVSHGLSQGAYLLAAGSSSWTGVNVVAYNGNVPAFAMEASTGRAAILWADSTQLIGDFYR